MRHKNHLAALTGLLLCVPIFGQNTEAAKPAAVVGASAAHLADLANLNLSLMLPEPPSSDSSTTRSELKELHRLESERTPAQAAAAKADDAEQDIFIFRTVFGPSFTPGNLPLLAKLSTAIHAEEGAASTPLKTAFARPRPYQADTTLHPICKLTAEPNSYPSGHTLTGYMLAFALVDIVPEKKSAILARADDYAHNRLVCGVHYPSDLDASRELAAAVFGSMSSNPVFIKDLAAARTELRIRLNINTDK
jgi:acid phosphatase (class A)